MHVHDLQSAAAEFPDGSKRALRLGHRTTLGIPLLKEDEAIGTLLIRRMEVSPFTEKQIALLTTFAREAVIAIDNSRLLRELRQRTSDLSEALEQQTATSEVLSVISSSPDDLKPVFQTMLESATRTCVAKFGILYLCEGEKFRPVALASPSPEFEAYVRERAAFVPDPNQPLGQLLQTKAIVHFSADNRSGGCRIQIRRRENPYCRAYVEAERSDRLDQYLSPRGAPVYRQTNRVSEELRQSGRNCD